MTLTGRIITAQRELTSSEDGELWPIRDCISSIHSLPSISFWRLSFTVWTSHPCCYWTSNSLAEQAAIGQMRREPHASLLNDVTMVTDMSNSASQSNGSSQTLTPETRLLCLHFKQTNTSLTGKFIWYSRLWLWYRWFLNIFAYSTINRIITPWPTREPERVEKWWYE